jgi:hypothetical protein
MTDGITIREAVIEVITVEGTVTVGTTTEGEKIVQDTTNGMIRVETVAVDKATGEAMDEVEIEVGVLEEVIKMDGDPHEKPQEQWTESQRKGQMNPHQLHRR